MKVTNLSFRRLSLLRRWPHLIFREPKPEDQEIIAPGNRTTALAQRFAVLDELLMPTFRRLDRIALLNQNAELRFSVGILVAEKLTAVLGIAQEHFGGYWGVGQSVLSAVLCSLIIASGLGSQKLHLHARLAAESLRHDFFMFLGALGRYAGPQAEDILQQRVQAFNHMHSKDSAGEENAKEENSIGKLPKLEEREFLAAYKTYRFNDQIVYYRKRVNEYGAAIRQGMWLNFTFALFITVASSLELAPIEEVRHISTFVAAALPFLSDGLNSYLNIQGYSRQKALYQDALSNLEGLGQQEQFLKERGHVFDVEDTLKKEMAVWGQLAEQEPQHAAA